MNVLNDEYEVPSSCVLKFGADWCGPCRILDPVMEEIASENPHVQMFSVNCDEASGLTSKFQVKNIPLVVFINDGKVVDKLIGANPKETIQAKLDLHFGKAEG